MPEKGADDIPSTLKRSPPKARRTWKKTHDSAVEEYGEGERAHRTAFASLKHSFMKVGDRWLPKNKKGPSDPRAAQTAAKARAGKGKTYGGVDVFGSSKKDLTEQAKRLGVKGYSTMSKDELGEAIDKANDKKTAQARNKKKPD